ncbi:MAG: TonB family protein [Hyphomicrobiales bacterium]|nr:TonB family protein [Hyphomicrobiales bacterium]MDE2114577.1 TonB family protein [Hyphomicrobiales bacterium]
MSAATFHLSQDFAKPGSADLKPGWLRPLAISLILALHVGLFLKLAAPPAVVVTPLGAVEVVMVAEGENIAAAPAKAVPLPAFKPPEPVQAAAPPPPPAAVTPPPPPPIQTPTPVTPVAAPPPPPVSVPLPVQQAPDPVLLPPPPPMPDLKKIEMEQQKLHQQKLQQIRHEEKVREEKVRQEQQHQKLLREKLARKRALARHLHDVQMARARSAARASAAAQARRQGARHAVAAVNGMSPATYGRRILMLIQAHKFYPEQARARGDTGSVGISFSVGASGRITGASVTSSSGSSVLDSAARRTVLSVHAPPPPSGAFHGSTSIHYSLH